MPKFYQLPIDTVFTLIGEPAFLQYKKISDTRAIKRTFLNVEAEWDTSAQYPFRPETEVINLDVKVSEWETFTIEITHEPGDRATEDARAEITERFESELYRLVQKYQGQAGLKFFARNSEGEIAEYY
jgi:hypothetical protein